MAQEEDQRACEVTFHPYRYLSVNSESTGRSGVCYRAKTSLYHPFTALQGYILVYITNMKPKPERSPLERLGTFDRDWPCHHRLSKSGLKTYSPAIQLSSTKDGFS